MTHPLITDREQSFQNLTNLIPGKMKIGDLTTKVIEDFYKGDHWQNGTQYIGPEPSQDDSNFGVITLQNKKKFCSRNVIREGVDRVRDACLSKAPDWKFDDVTKAESRSKLRQQLMDKIRTSIANARQSIANVISAGEIISNTKTESNTDHDDLDVFLTQLWETSGIIDALKKLIVSRLKHGRGLLRMYIPRKYYSPSGELLKTEDIREAARRIRFEFVEPDKGIILDDDAEKLSIIRHTKKVYEQGTNYDVNLIEFSYLDADNRTIIGIVKEDQSIKDAQLSTAVDLNENLAAFEITGDPLVTEGLVQCNRLLNLALTMSGHSLIDNGFTELAVTNVEFAMDTVTNEDGSQEQVPGKIKRGGGRILDLQGRRYFNAEGAESVASPGVHYKNPTDLKVFEEGKSLAYTACLEEIHQVYVKILEDPTTTGESRIQARQDFIKSVETYKTDLDKAGSWAFNVAKQFAAIMLGEVDRFKGIVIRFDTKIFAGKLTAVEQAEIRNQYREGVMSLETAMVLLGVDDVEAERQMLELDQEEKLLIKAREAFITAAAGASVEPSASDTKQTGTIPTKSGILASSAEIN